MEEIWKPCPLYNHKMPSGEWKYEVSNLGQVRIPAHKNNQNQLVPEHILRQRKNYGGYLKVRLYDGHRNRKNVFVHRLVAMAFIPNPNNEEQVNHIDEKKYNNVESNLEWCSSEYNLHYGTRASRISKPVCQYSFDGVLIAEYCSISEAAKQTGIHRSNIGKCCNGKHKTSHGFMWRFKE